VLIERLEADLERAVDDGAPGDRVERQQAEAHARVVELEIRFANALALEVDLPAVGTLTGEHERALLERLLGVEGPRGRRREQQRDD